jgi:putative ABC transport system permease protein
VVAGVVAALLAAYLPARLAATVDPAETLRRQAQVVVRRPLPHRALFFAGTALLIPAIALSRIARLRVGFAAMGMFLLVVLFMTPSLLLALRKRLVGPFESLLGVPGRLALDNAARRLDRSALIAGALMLSVSASVLLGTWGASMERSALFWLDRALPADLYVTSGSVVADQHNVAFRPEVMDKLRGLRGVRRAYPVRIVTLDVRDRRILMVALDGAAYFDAIESKQMAPIVLDGPDPLPLDAVTERPGILLAENSARRLGVGAGDRVTFETPTGTVDLEVVAVVVDYTSDQGAAIIDRRWYLHYWGDPMIDTIDLVLEPGADPEAVRSEVKSRLGGGEQLFVVSAADLREEIRRILVDSLAVFRSTELIALVVALLGVIGTLLAAVLDRTREIGVLRAIGTTRSQVLRAVVGEAGFLGLASAVGGVLAGIPMGYVFVDVVALTSTGWRFEYVFPEAAALRVTGLVVFAAAVAGIWPGRHAARLDVPEALSYE